MRENRLGITAATAPDLHGFDLDGFLKGLQPAASIAARHTVGLADALTAGDLDPTQRLNDGLPETLEEVIATYGHRYFKLKVAGQIDGDIARLTRIAEVLDNSVGAYHATLDGNEQFEHIDAVSELWRRIGEEPRLARLKAAILFLEQPIARARAFAQPVHALSQHVALEIDESDADIEAFPARPRARLSRHLVEILQGLLSRAAQSRPRRALEFRGRARTLFHVGRGFDHASRRRCCSRTSRWRRLWARRMSSATAITMSTA